MIIKEISDKNFGKLLSENDYVLAFFRTDWCPLCDIAEEILTKLETKYSPLSLFIIDFDKNRSLADKQGVIGVPSVMVFKSGDAVGFFPGLRDEFSYEEMTNVLVFKL
jgi:thioredoxin 1